MSFWTGFGTGLAKSVDQGLQKAMSKRDDELSRAKTFWQTRQAQKLDQKEAYDARAEKALRRMIQEAGDDASLGLAAFNAAGGDPDSVEAFIKRIDNTRANKGTYNLLDSLKDADGNPIKAGENAVGMEAALKSVRMQMKGIDASNIKIDDPLSKFGLGLKGGAAQAAADSVNTLIPPEKVEQLTGIPKATLDMSNMLEAEKYVQDQKLIAKQLTPTLAESNASIVQEIMSLDPKADNFAEESARLIAKQEQVLTAIGDEAKAKEMGVDVDTMKAIEKENLSPQSIKDQSLEKMLANQPDLSPTGNEPSSTVIDEKALIREQAELFKELLGEANEKKLKDARIQDASDYLLKFFEGSQKEGATVGSSAADVAAFATSRDSRTQRAKDSIEKGDQTATALAINDYIAGKRSKEQTDQLITKLGLSAELKKGNVKEQIRDATVKLGGSPPISVLQSILAADGPVEVISKEQVEAGYEPAQDGSDDGKYYLEEDTKTIFKVVGNKKVRV